MASSPAADRNKQPIMEVLMRVLPARGLALEIASGTGQHVAWFAAALRSWVWQPSDADPQALPAIVAASAGLANVRAPMLLDVVSAHWPAAGQKFAEPLDAVYCANMLHISPWESCGGLMRGTARHLALDGRLILYGPFFETGIAPPAGNVTFDASLRERNPLWGVRKLDDVAAQARMVGLTLHARHALPANNLLLIFGRSQ